MNRLQQILDTKLAEIARLLPRQENLRAAAMQRNDFRPFAATLDRGPDALGLIAEVKRASPSAGLIAPEFAPVDTARQYEAAGAHAISVLTDEKYFSGHLIDLTKVRTSVALPCLRKDFILHDSQIFEAAVAGADAILLIVAALSQRELVSLYKTADLCQLDVLVEVHTREELDRAVDLGAKLIGINNRNLATFEVDLATTEELSEEVPDHVILVSESGIKTQADARRVHAAGCQAILVGESLMRTGNIPVHVKELLSVGSSCAPRNAG